MVCILVFDKAESVSPSFNSFLQFACSDMLFRVHGWLPLVFVDVLRGREAGVGVLHLVQPKSPPGSFDILKRTTGLYVSWA